MSSLLSHGPINEPCLTTPVLLSSKLLGVSTFSYAAASYRCLSAGPRTSTRTFHRKNTDRRFQTWPGCGARTATTTLVTARMRYVFSKLIFVALLLSSITAGKTFSVMRTCLSVRSKRSFLAVSYNWVLPLGLASGEMYRLTVKPRSLMCSHSYCDCGVCRRGEVILLL